MSQSVKLVSVATAVPPHVLEQRDVAAAAHRTFALRFADFERLARVFKTSGIHRRYAVRPIEWYLEPLGWPERSNAYRDGAWRNRALAALCCWSQSRSVQSLSDSISWPRQILSHLRCLAMGRRRACCGPTKRGEPPVQATRRAPMRSGPWNLLDDSSASFSTGPSHRLSRNI